MSASEPPQLPVLPGRILIGCGGLGILLVFATQVDGLPGAWQSFIRSNAAMWLLGSALLIICGIRLLWQAGHHRTAWKPERPGIRFQSIIIYTRPDCLLCDDAVEILNQYRRWLPIPSEVNIQDDAELVRLYGDSIPVVVIDGKRRFQGHVNEVLLRRLIEGTPPAPILRIL